MSKSEIDLKQVEEAMATLSASGKEPTSTMVRALLGKGSFSTILKHMRQVKGVAAASSDSAHALESFRQIWSEAVQAGRAQRDDEVADYEESLNALSVENDTLQGEIGASRATAEQASKKYEELLLRFNNVNDALSRAREEAATNSGTLLDITEKHHHEIERIRKELTQAQSRAHEFELKSVAAEAKLEALSATRTRKGKPQ